MMISAIISAAGYLYLDQQKQLAIDEAKLDLSTIVDLKVSQIVQWRKERLLEAKSIYSNTMLSHRIKDGLIGRDKEGAFNEIREWLASLQNSTGYSNIILFTPKGEVLSSAVPVTKPQSSDRDIIKSAVQNKAVTLSDLHFHADAAEYEINLVIPILDPVSSGSDCIAVIVIDINPIIHLYPLFRTWPTPSRTGENLLIRRDGDDVLFLNKPRFWDDSAPALRQPLTEKNLPAVRAALGQEGLFAGVDYRGANVIAAIRTVPNSNWAIVCKVDTSEVLEQTAELSWYVVAAGLIILIAICLAISLWWRWKREAFFSRQYETELKYNSEMKQAELALQEANNLLEERVVRRTEELTNANFHLKQEISDRKHFEELLRMHFQVILQSPVAIIITDLDGTIEFVNPKFTEYCGYSYEEAIGQNPRILKSEVTPPEFHKKLWETLVAGKAWEGEICNRKKSGELFWEYAKILPITNQDSVITNYMAFKEDITRHKLLEEKLLRSQKMETIGQIAGGVAHEVRNPLNAILSITEALFKEKEIENNPEFEPYIQHIRTQVNRLAHIMNELLDLGKTIPTSNSHSIPLYEVCREAIDLWNSSGSAQKIPVILTAATDQLTTCVMADRGRLVQVIFNLLENAAQHSTDSSTIIFDLIDSNGTNPTDPVAVIRITDAGSGITPENMARVFDPFFTDRRGGTGLGLALVKHFIEEMGGSVVLFNNDPPPGCSAEVHIPKAVEKQE